MRTPDRDRCRSGISLLGTALVLTALLVLATPVSALSATYQVLPNGSAYYGMVQVEKSSGFQFYEIGVLGERVPVKVTNISLAGACEPCTFNASGDYAISYPLGNYTISYQGPIRDSHLVTGYDNPYNVTVTLTQGLDVRNPLLGVISPGGNARLVNNTTVEIQWTGARSVEVRFYDQARESLLYLFGNFWVIVAVVLLTPYLLSMRRKKNEKI